MKTLPRKRLQGLEQARAREPHTRFVWVEAGDTDADFAARCDRMVADGTASPDDRFVPIGWKDG